MGGLVFRYLAGCQPSSPLPACGPVVPRPSIAQEKMGRVYRACIASIQGGQIFVPDKSSAYSGILGGDIIGVGVSDKLAAAAATGEEVSD